MWSFFQFINDECTLTIVDVGAAMTEVPPYQNLIDIKRARLIGFEPDADACRRLNDSYGKPHLFLPYFVGDGRPAIFHETNWGPTGSLFEPNTPLLEKFHYLGELVVPLAQHPVTTKRMDDIVELDDVDFIKIDVQGSELAVFRNASRALADAVLIQTEVAFLEQYKKQPMFSDIDAFLRASGFQFHDLQGIGSRSFKPVMSPNPSYMGFRQRVWADAYYVKDWMTWDTLPPAKLKRLAALLHDLVGSYDLAHLALEAMDRQQGTQLAPGYLRRLREGGQSSLSGADGRVARSADVDGKDTIDGDQRRAFPKNTDDCLSGGKVRRVLNVGGNSKEIRLPSHYDGWQHVLLDIDPDCTPDVLCDARDLFGLPVATYDAVYCSHNLEHYYPHDVTKVLAGFLHVLKDNGFAHIRVPDMAALMRVVVERELDIDDFLYQSQRGPIAVRDVIYGLTAEIERSGNDFFAHKTGFSDESLTKVLHRAGFSKVFLRTESLEVEAFAFRNEPDQETAKHFGLTSMSLSEGHEPAQRHQKMGELLIGGWDLASSNGEPREQESVAERPPMEVVTADGMVLMVPASLGCITTYVLLEQEQWFERELRFLRRWMKKGMNAIDIGANVGVYSLPLARAVGDSGRVFAFEPGASSRGLLEAGSLRNNLGNLEVSACALSDAEKEGWLTTGWSGELNSLGEAPSGSQTAERVRVSSLDIQAQEHQWPSIDFIKIDAELQEARIVAGGRSFFNRHSPLVMYEINRGSSQHESVRWIFEALGYGCYRLLGDATALVPVASDEPLDSFELNLFAAKPDRAASLAEQGLLVVAPAGYSLTDSERSHALELALARPYARAFEFSLDDIGACPFGDALVAYAAYRYGELSAARRYAALNFAFTMLQDCCREAESATCLATLTRVALDLGRHREAIEALRKLVKVTGVEIDQPFFPPCERYEQLSPEGRESEWFVAACNEQFEVARSHSSCFLANELARLKWLCAGPFSSPAMNRRLILEAARQGAELQELLGYVNYGHPHQNSGYWTVAGLPELLRLF